MNPRWATGAIVATGLVFFATLGVAQAQPSAQHSGADEDAVDERDFKAVYQRARRRVKAGDTQGALEDYRRAYELSDGNLDWKVLVNLGATALRAGEHLEAANALRAARKRLPPSDPRYEEYSLKLDERLNKAKAHLGEIALTAEPAGATIIIDDQRVGQAPLDDTVFVTPGKHVVKVTQIGLGTEVLTVEVAAKQRQEVTLVLTGVDDGAWRLPVGATAGAAGVVSLATGIGLFVASMSTADDVLFYQQQVDAVPNMEAPCGVGVIVVDGCQQLEAASNEELTYRTLGIASIVAGGVLLATGTTLLLWPDGEAAEPTVALRISPWANTTTAAVSLEGMF